MKTILIGLAAAAFLSGAANARSIVVTRDALPTARVSYADLDLANIAGRATLQGRIRSAADTVCEVAGDRSLKTQLAVISCTHVAIADGLRQADRIIERKLSGATVATAATVVRGR
jgi:UrcA family protein